MVICFDANTESKRALDALLETGQFKDTSEAISMALVNYEVLQRSISRGEPSVMKDATSPKDQPSKSIAPEVSFPRSTKPTAPVPQIPELFFINSSNADGIKLASIAGMSEGVPSNLPPAR